MQTNRTPRESQKRQQIVETTERLFLRYGIRRITVEEICQQAGVSKMTFYRYFRNKRALALHIWQTWIEQGCERLDAVCALSVPFLEKLQRMLEYKLQRMERMRRDSTLATLTSCVRYGISSSTVC